MYAFGVLEISYKTFATIEFDTIYTRPAVLYSVTSLSANAEIVVEVRGTYFLESHRRFSGYAENKTKCDV